MTSITKADFVYVSTSKNADYVEAVPHEGAVKFIRADPHDDTKAQPAECETRLRKVVEALWEIRLEYDPSDDSLNSRTMYDIACDVLAEIEKGGV